MLQRLYEGPKIQIRRTKSDRRMIRFQRMNIFVFNLRFVSELHRFVLSSVSAHKSLCMQVEEEMVPKGLQSTLRLKGPAERQDSARFECLARNDFGSNKTEINFIVQVSISNYPFITD